MILVWCSMGIGNALNNIVNALWLQEKYNMEVTILWNNAGDTRLGVNFNHCKSKFEDLYEIKYIDKESLENYNFNGGNKEIAVTDYFSVISADNCDIVNLSAKKDAIINETNLDYQVVQELSPKRSKEDLEPNVHYISYKDNNKLQGVFEKLNRINKNYQLSCYQMFPFLTYEDIVKQIYKIRPKKKFLEISANFVENNEININVKGISIRVSDMDNFESYVLNGKSLNDISSTLYHKVDKFKERGYVLILEEIEKMIKRDIKTNSTQKYYVTADEKKYEKHFKELFPDNVIIREKETDIKKANEDFGWIVDWKTDVFNLVRDNEYVQDSLVDALIMSKTNYSTYFGASTYTKYIKYLQSIDYNKGIIK
jgi:hypothetical protein